MPDRKLLTPVEVADLLGIKPSTLNVWRCTGRYKLPYVKVGKLVRYERRVVEQFIRENTIGGEYDALPRA